MRKLQHLYFPTINGSPTLGANYYRSIGFDILLWNYKLYWLFICLEMGNSSFISEYKYLIPTVLEKNFYPWRIDLTTELLARTNWLQKVARNSSFSPRKYLPTNLSNLNQNYRNASSNSTTISALTACKLQIQKCGGHDPDQNQQPLAAIRSAKGHRTTPIAVQPIDIMASKHLLQNTISNQQQKLNCSLVSFDFWSPTVCLCLHATKRANATYLLKFVARGIDSQ
jgi:hypothetical protein